MELQDGDILEPDVGPVDAGGDDQSLEEQLQSLPDRITQGVVNGLNPPSTPEQVDWANQIMNDADTYDDDMQQLLKKRSDVTNGPQGTLERLKAARARLAGQQYDPDNKRMWGSVAAALGQHGSIGEAMGRTAGAMNAERTAQDKFSDSQRTELGSIDKDIATTQTGDYDSQMKALQLKIAARNAERLKAMQILGKGKSVAAGGTPTAAKSNVLKMADDWFTNQRPGVAINSKIMDQAAERAGQVDTGPGYGLVSALSKSEHELPQMVGDFIKSVNNPDIKELERDVRSVIFPTVRQVLGAQFTAKENFTLLETAFDPAAPREVNKRRLLLILSGLKDAMSVKDEYFTYARQHGGDMSGYTGHPLSEIDRIGDQILNYAGQSGAERDAAKPRPPINRETPATPAVNTKDEFIFAPNDRNTIIRNPNFKKAAAASPSAPGAVRVLPPRPQDVAPAADPADPKAGESFWDILKRKASQKFADGGAVDADDNVEPASEGGTEVIEIAGRKFTVPKGLSDEQIYALIDAQEANEKQSVDDQKSSSGEVLGDAAVDAGTAAAGYGGAYALQRLHDAANERSPHEVNWGSESYGLDDNQNYLRPGKSRFTDRFGVGDDIDPEQRLDALIARHKDLQMSRGLPRATAAEAMSPEQLSLVNEAMRSPNSNGAGATELRANLGENQAAMLAGDPLDVDKSGRARSEGHTLDTLQADMQSTRPYKDVLEHLENERKNAYDPLRKQAMNDRWVGIKQFDPDVIADTQVGRSALDRASQSWMNSADTNGRPMLRGKRINPGDPAVVPNSYDVEFLDNVRKALNDMHVESVQGRGNFAPRDINAWRRRYTGALYAARPDLQSANAEYERLSRPIDAAKVGRGDTDANSILWRDDKGNYNTASAFDKMPTEELRDYLGALDDDSKAALRSGLYENYRSSIQDTSAARNPLDSIFGSEERPSENMNRLKMLFESDPQGLQTMMADIKAHSNSYDVAHQMGAKSESARGRPRGAPVSKSEGIPAKAVNAVTAPVRRVINGAEGNTDRKFSTEEVNDIARIASEHRLQSLARLQRAAANRAGRKGRAGRAGLLGAGAGTLFALKDQLRALADDALGNDGSE